MRTFEYAFFGPVEELDFGRMAYHVVWLPRELEDRLPFKKYPRLRIDAEIGGIFLNCAFQIGGQRRYVILSGEFLKQSGLVPGQTVTVRFNLADQTAVEVPSDLEQALANHPLARKAWEACSPGKKRGLIHRIAGAKRPETRERRIDEVLASLLQEVSAGEKS